MITKPQCNPLHVLSWATRSLFWCAGPTTLPLFPSRQRVGAKIQCSTCYVAYHPLCARMAGLRMEIQERQDAAGGVRLISYCPRHCTPKPEQSGAHAGPTFGRYCFASMWFVASCCVITCIEAASDSL